ncbi:MAG: hypothetical protein RL318_3071 [Fibrobacterota bacterium]|jgi:hypothetical protein
MAILLLNGISFALESVSHSNYAQVKSTALYSRADSLPVVGKTFRVVSVKDLRQISIDNSRMLGSTSSGPFQERTWLWADEAVDQDVKRQLDLWFPDSGAAKLTEIRIEIASFETWTVPTTNPASAKALVRLRVISVENNWRGMQVEASLVREGPNTPENQAALLRSCLRNALFYIIGQDWSNMPPLPKVGERGPEPDSWTNALRLSGNRPQSVSRTLVHASQTIGQSGYGTSIRAIFYHEPETDLNPEFWAGVRLRDPDVDGYDAWVAEVMGGKGYQKRLGATSIVMVSTFGMLFGIEKFQEEGHSKDFWKYVGFETRSGGRWEPEGFKGISGEVGAHGAIRIPSTLQFFDFGFYIEIGNRF